MALADHLQIQPAASSGCERSTQLPHTANAGKSVDWPSLARSHEPMSSKPIARPRSWLRLRRFASTNIHTGIKPTLRSVRKSTHQQAFPLAFRYELVVGAAGTGRLYLRNRAKDTGTRRVVSVSPCVFGAPRYAASQMGRHPRRLLGNTSTGAGLGEQRNPGKNRLVHLGDR